MHKTELKPRAFRPFAAPLILAFFLATGATAYETYSGCQDCHGAFGGPGDTGSQSLHGLHTGGTPMTTNCNLCHISSSTRSNPVIMWSKGDSGTPGNGLGCMGCHGRDYGETIEGNYRGVTIIGKPKNSGRGLRRHHAGKGVTECASCHADAEPYPENVMNPGLGNTTHYYFRNDVSLGGSPMDTCINENSANDGSGDNATPGLDNDGDGLYDRNDPDCVADGLRMNIIRDGSGNIILSWPAPGENWALYENPAASGTGWTIMAAPTFRVNGRWEKTITPAPGDRFYRLEKP